ncbi:MAG: citrate transporter [Chloroflexi bacterium]|nr:citrate transporter [Chloroflexota bacterium]
MIFGIDPIFALIPLIVYVIISFKEDWHPVMNIFICVVLAAILTKQPFANMGRVMADAMGSFLGMIGLIIMLGAGLGAVLHKTGVAENLVMSLVKGIGVNTEKKAIITTMISSTVLVALLGTLAGANAIIAPIIIPLVAAVAVTPSAIAVCFLGAGLTGMFLGPYTPQVVTILGITNLSYGQYITSAGIPLAVVVLLITFFWAVRAQKKTKGVYAYEDVEAPQDNYTASQATKQATIGFLVSILGMIAYGMVIKGGAAFAILAILVSAIVTGISVKLKIDDLINTFIAGSSKLMWLFIMFLLFNPFIDFIAGVGAFDRLVELLQPLLASGNRVLFSLIATLTGIFGIGGAATADNVVMDSMFRGLVDKMGISMLLWALILLVSGQITSFAYPEADMIGQMGLARSKDVKTMVKFGLTVVLFSTILVVVMSILNL